MVVQPHTRAFSSLSHSTPRPRGPVCPAAMEPLERRELLSGDVSVVSTVRSATITGDDAGNAIIIESDGFGSYQVRSDDGTTTFNGGLPGPVPVALSGTVTIKLKGGSDNCILNGVWLTRPLTIDVGLGGGQVLFQGFTGQNVTVKGAAQGVNVYFQVNPANNQVNGKLSVSACGGSVSAGILNSVIVGSTTVSNPRGTVWVGAEAVSVGGTEYSTSLGALTVRGGAGDNSVTIGANIPVVTGSVTVFGAVKITLGTGANYVLLNKNAWLQKGLSVTTGAGVDEMYLGANGGLVQIDGKTTLKAGDGGDVIAFKNLIVNGVFTFNGGPGNDTISGDTVTFNNKATIDGGPGGDWWTPTAVSSPFFPLVVRNVP
ncbi:MAG: hypothetical protein PHU85_19645 [Phycisphaerae bacterium]|nr:hypothetical protein [Phycisphaerae bacterium]